MNCLKCGRAVPEDGVFCPYCGADLRSLSAEETAAVRSEPEVKKISLSKSAPEQKKVDLLKPAAVEDLKAETAVPESKKVDLSKPAAAENTVPDRFAADSGPRASVHETVRENGGKKSHVKKLIPIAVLAVLLAAVLGSAVVRYRSNQEPAAEVELTETAASDVPAAEGPTEEPVEEESIPTPTPAALTAEQRLVADAVKSVIGSEEFTEWQADYAKSTGKDPAAPEVSAVLHYQIGNFECYLVNITADVRYADPAGSKTNASRFGLFIGSGGEEIIDSVAADADNFDNDVSTREGRIRYLLWAFANRLSGKSKGNYLNDVEVRTEWSDEALARINTNIR